MTDQWQIFVFLGGLVAAWSGLMLGVQKTMMRQQFLDLGRQIAEIREIAEQGQNIERQILELKADLPLNYVRKEDFIRHEGVINTKLDRLRDLVESLRERRKEKRQEDS